MSKPQIKHVFIALAFPSTSSGRKVGVPDYPRAIGEAMP
jgi:hypothetical protein